MFKSWSVGKPQILVQVSEEKNKKQRYLSKKNDQTVLHIYKWKILYMYIYWYMYCKLKQQL